MIDGIKTEIRRSLEQPAFMSMFLLGLCVVLISYLGVANIYLPNFDQLIVRPNTAFFASTVFPSSLFPTSTVPHDFSDVADVTSGKMIFGVSAGGGVIYRDQIYLDKYFKQLNDLGVTWVRTDIDWSMVQPKSKDEYDWKNVDRFILTAQRHNIHVLGIITYTPKWARSRACTSNYRCAPASSEEFGVFAETVAARYKGVVNVWEIWNEPNMAQFWQPASDARAYGKALASAYTHIKKVNPQAFIMSAGLASVSDTKVNVSPLTFMGTLYVHGYNKYFDAVALHPYTYPASIDRIATWNSWLQMKTIRLVMAIRGDGKKKIWVTEFGAPTNGPGKQRRLNDDSKFAYGSDYMSEGDQRVLIESAARFYTNNQDWMRGFFAFNLFDEKTTRPSTEASFGLVRTDDSKKPAYYALQQVIASSTAAVSSVR